MKKLLIIFAIMLFGSFSNAEELTLLGEAQFNWVDMTQIQRDSNIQHYKELLFGDDAVKSYTKDEFRQKFAPYLKDKNYKEHYRLSKMGQTETEDANLCAFFFKSDILLIYAIQYKNNLRNVYYYNAYGRLQYVDDISENYPNFPYNSKQYRVSGKPVSTIYFVSPEIQYMYEPDGKFKGLWYKEKMYDKNGKQKVVRSNWEI